MEEVWLPVPGYEGSYEVSNRGQVHSLDRLDSRGRFRRGRILKFGKHTQGYNQVSLSKDGIQITRLVHQLVLEAFAGPRPAGLVSCHDNDVPDDNRWPENLRWDTLSSNTNDRVKNGLHGTYLGPVPVGTIFNRWTTTSEPEHGNKARYTSCVCECGKLGRVPIGSLRSGSSKSCGCFAVDMSTTHGLTGTPLHQVWCLIRSKCNDPGNDRYPNTGAVGVRVCDAWNSFESFQSWAESAGYNEGNRIRRLDPQKDYEPGNCEWYFYVPSSSYRGVYKGQRGYAWQVKFRAGGKQMFFGNFNDEIEAALAADAAIRKHQITYYKKPCPLNFPVS